MDTRDAAAGRATSQGAAVEVELAALRARLGAVEAALGLSAGPGGPAPPRLPALARRVAALERRAGIVPGLDPLPGCGGVAAPAAPLPVPRRARWRAWSEGGQALLAVVLVGGLCAWLLRPLPRTAPVVPPTSAPAPVRVVAARPGPTCVPFPDDAPAHAPLNTAPCSPKAGVSPSPALPAAPWPPCDHDADAGCPWHAGPRAVALDTPSAWPPCDWVATGRCGGDVPPMIMPTPVPGETPCPLGGTGPCGAVGLPVPAGGTPCARVDNRALPGAGCAGAPSVGVPEPCPLPDERVCLAER